MAMFIYNYKSFTIWRGTPHKSSLSVDILRTKFLVYASSCNYYKDVTGDKALRVGGKMKVKSTKGFKGLSKKKILIGVIIAFAVAPMLINLGLIVTDMIYDYTGIELTAYGLDNLAWLDFWKQYLGIVISFVGIYLVYISSIQDRKNKLNEDKYKQYMEEVRKEEKVLVDVVKNLNIVVVFEAILRIEDTKYYQAMKVVSDARTAAINAQIEFELLTDLSDDFKKCEVCQYALCADAVIMKDLRDVFYNMQNCYFKMMQFCEDYVSMLNKESERIHSLGIYNKLYSNTEQLVNLYATQGLSAKVIESRQELDKIVANIENLKNAEISSLESNRVLTSILREKDYMEKELRPKFIRYSKIYIDAKKKHAKELLELGHIVYTKVDESGTVGKQ